MTAMMAPPPPSLAAFDMTWCVCSTYKVDGRDESGKLMGSGRARSFTREKERERCSDIERGNMHKSWDIAQE